MFYAPAAHLSRVVTLASRRRCRSDVDCFRLLLCYTTGQGKYADAEPLYERCQAIEEKVLGPEHPSLAITLNNRAGLLQAQVRTDGTPS